jgi:hypothetical protein
MGKVRTLGTNALRRLNSALKIEMSRVRAMPKSVKNQHVKVAEKRPRHVWNLTAIGEICKCTHPVTQDRKRAMAKWDWNDRAMLNRERTSYRP